MTLEFVMQSLAKSKFRRALGAAKLLAVSVAFAFIVAPGRLPAAPRIGDGPDGDRDRLLNDQSQVFDRLTSLRKRMERLAVKLEQEGNGYKADLLRKSIAEIDSRALEARKDDLLHKLKDSSLQTFDQQEKLLNDLNDVLKLLLDEKKLTDVDQKLKDVQETRASAREIRGMERKLREKTESLTGDEQESLERLEKQLEELLEKQKQLDRDAAEEAKRR